MDFWRTYFDSSNQDIWSIIDHAILLAFIDHPEELKRRRDGIAEKLFAPASQYKDYCRQSGELDDGMVSKSIEKSSDISRERVCEDEEDDDEECERNYHRQSQAAYSLREEEEDGEDEEEEDVDEDEPRNARHETSYADAEALSNEMEEECRQMKQIESIKTRLMDPNQTEDHILRLLRALESMDISYEALKTTGIGKQVNLLRKHDSLKIRTLVKGLIRVWKSVVDEWTKNAEDVAAAADRGNGSCDGEYGLPSPPIDEGELLAARTAPVEMNQLLEYMDSGIGARPVNGGEDDANSPFGQVSNGSSQGSHSPNGRPVRNKSGQNTTNTMHDDAGRPGNLTANKIVKRNNGSGAAGETPLPSNKGANAGMNPQRTGSVPARPKTVDQACPRQPQLKRPSSLMKPGSDRESLRLPKETSGAEKLAAAKRKLQDEYKQAENAKKQRTVQVMEVQDLPKGGNKSGNKLHTHNQHRIKSGNWRS